MPRLTAAERQARHRERREREEMHARIRERLARAGLLSIRDEARTLVEAKAMADAVLQSLPRDEDAVHARTSTDLGTDLA